METILKATNESGLFSAVKLHMATEEKGLISFCIFDLSYSSENLVTMMVAGSAIIIRPQNTAKDPMHFPRVERGIMSP